ncbi:MULTISPECIES: lactonase family protein [Acidobacteriaceae]|uniref:lactonase family protein n=1 Tax=Acidobacteriaceae TaxID=204434 RepID=UPI001C208281|nr:MULTISPECIES: lactonase family protein [Acidobacteriaceae]MDW5264633.1 lactonase family protein [Edaphobacter sp.]
MAAEDLVKQVSMNEALSRRGFLKGATALSIAHSVSAVAQGSKDNAPNGRTLAYVGCYTGAIGDGSNGKGIYLFEMDSRTGALLPIKLVVEAANPSWLSLDPSGRYLYAANEVTNFDGTSGSVSAYAVDRASGDLKFLNTVSSEGGGPAYLSTDADGKYVFVANYAGGTIAVFPILPDGQLARACDLHLDSGSVGSTTPTNAPPGSFAWSGHDAPHAHMIQADPNNRFVLHTDLGQDRIYVHRFDQSKGKLTPAATPFIALPTGDGPRHLAFHPNGRWLYSIQEEASTLTFFHYDPSTGSLAPQQTISTLPQGFTGTSFASGIKISADGRFLYAANRLHDTIAVFSIESDGRLKSLGEVSTMGDYPNQFNIDPSGKFLYACNRKSDVITSFSISRDTGLLTFTGHYTPVGSASCIVFLR